MGGTEKAQNYKFDNFFITVTAKDAKTISLSVVNQITRTQYGEENIVLKEIGFNTIEKAFSKNSSQIELFIRSEQKQNLLFLIFKIDCPFIKKIEQIIPLKKIKVINIEVFMNRQIDFLSQKLSQITVKSNENKILCTHSLQARSFFGAAQETISKLSLSKGKYLLTFACLAKVTNQWVYFYLNNSQIYPQGGTYLNNNNQFEPICLRMIHSVHSEWQDVQIQTYCASSYPVTIMNSVFTAKKLILKQ